MRQHLQKKNEKPNTLIGTWVNGDACATEVEYIVSSAAQGFAVRAVDRFDGEEGDVYGVTWDGNGLSFGVHWNSTGRFVKARLQAIAPNRVDYTYTFTEQQVWHRKGTEPTAAPRRHPARRSVKRAPRRGGGR